MVTSTLLFQQSERHLVRTHKLQLMTHAQFHSFAFKSLISAKDLKDDKVFYDHYSTLADGYGDTVCGNDTTKRDLRATISEADEIFTRETGSELVSSDLANRSRFCHVDEGIKLYRD